MELGWIDFSKTERNNVLNILERLGEKGILDVLGIAAIRDSFSDLFFPGTSTIQTRAKYFCIVPYALKDLELSNESNEMILRNRFEDTEKRCAKDFYLNNRNEKGIIGVNAISTNSWVKRPPSNVYIAGLRKYGIFNSRMSIGSYIHQISDYNKEKEETFNSSKRYGEVDGTDDKYISSSFKSSLYIPTYNERWKKDLNINLTESEAEFLKDRIIDSCPDSMMATILNKELTEVIKFDSFNDVGGIIDEFPGDVQDEYFNAVSFSRFNKYLNVFYNLVVSNGENKKAQDEFKYIKENYKSISDIDIPLIMYTHAIDNESLMDFLTDSQKLMQKGDFEGLKDNIKGREVNLKGKDRSRTCNSQKYNDDAWFAGDDLHYRFFNARDIIADIFHGLGISEG